MNKVIADHKFESHMPCVGDIYCDADNDPAGYYLLGAVEAGKFVAIGLNSGNRWSNVCKNIDIAVHGLKFFKANATITIT